MKGAEALNHTRLRDGTKRVAAVQSQEKAILMTFAMGTFAMGVFAMGIGLGRNSGNTPLELTAHTHQKMLGTSATEESMVVLMET